MALPGRLYIDTNILVYAFEGGGPLASALHRLLLSRGSIDRPRLASSELTLAELLVLPYRHRDWALIEQYESWTTANDHIEIGPVDRSVLQAAAALRADYASLKLPDAIHLATAILVGCPYFLAADDRLKDTYQILGRSYGASIQSPIITVVRPELARLESWLGQ